MMTSQVEAQIVIPGLEEDRVVEAWVEGHLVLLRTEEGRLYSLPVGAVEVGLLPTTEQPPVEPSLSDIVDMLRAGVSERNVKALIETKRRAPYAITKQELIELERAGASEAFIHYLLHVGRAAPKTTYVTWPGPQWPPRETESAAEIGAPAAVQEQEGIPLFPYVFPGYGVSCPLGLVLPGGLIFRDKDPFDGRHPRKPEQHRLPGRSISGRSVRTLPHPGDARHEMDSSDVHGNRRFWLKWNGPGRADRSRASSGSSHTTGAGTVDTSGPALPTSVTSSSGGGRRFMGAAGPASSSSGSIVGRSLSGSSSSSGRSLTGKKN